MVTLLQPNLAFNRTRASGFLLVWIGGGAPVNLDLLGVTQTYGGEGLWLKIS
jgi:hypothetical protein